MIQQINLYQPILRRQKKVFSASTIAVLLLAFTLLMGLIWAANAWKLRALEQQLVDLQAQEARTVQQVTDISRNLSAQQEDPALRATVNQLEQEEFLKRRLLGTIGSETPGETHGFAATLEALARQRMPGIWLTRILLDESGKSLELRGISQGPKYVPAYLQLLSGESALQGRSFREMKVSRDEMQEGLLQFRLSTRNDETNDAAGDRP